MAFTPYLRLNKPPFDTIPWDTAINGDLDIIDGFIAQYMSVPNFAGAWANSTAYAVGQVLLDPTSATMWHCNVAHTSSAVPATFAGDRTTFPSYWTNTSTTSVGYLPLAGGTLTGPLTLSGAPTATLHAATKAYVDAQVVGVGGGGVATFNGRAGAVSLTSGDVTGALTYTPYNSSNPAGYQTFSDVSSHISGSLAYYYPITTTDARYLYKTGDLMTGSLNINPGSISVSDIIFGSGGRILSQGNNNNPCVAVYDYSTSWAAGMWVNVAGAIKFGATSGSGAPSTEYAYLTSGSLGFATTGSISITVSGGAASVCFGNSTSFTVPGTAWKPGGGAWSDSSDSRIKTVTGDYTSGLAAIQALHPVRYTLKNNWHRNDGMEFPHQGVTGQEFIGLVAQEAEVPMPEMVSQIDAMIDDVPVTDLRTLDMTALPLAIVNAIKELAQRVTALEGMLADRTTQS